MFCQYGRGVYVWRLEDRLLRSTAHRRLWNMAGLSFCILIARKCFLRNTTSALLMECLWWRKDRQKFQTRFLHLSLITGLKFCGTFCEKVRIGRGDGSSRLHKHEGNWQVLCDEMNKWRAYPPCDKWGSWAEMMSSSFATFANKNGYRW